MSQAAYSRYFDQKIANDAGGEDVRAFLAKIHLSTAQGVAPSADGVIAAFTCGTSKTTKTTGFTAMPYPRTVSATVAADTAGDIKAVQVTVTGTNVLGEVITEDLPAFTVDTPGIVTGAKAFASVTKVEVPAMDGTSPTVSIGVGGHIGLGYLLAHNTVLAAYKDNTKEGTAPTVAVSATDIESNTCLLSNALNGKVVDIYLMLPSAAS
jgi:hypothetical protein